jgi:SAM-dependent methyltransferase
MASDRASTVAVSSASLAARLEINKKHQGADFHGWLLRHLDVRPGMDVLDVGCGTGAQTLKMVESVGPKGSVSALDISAESVAKLTAAGRANLQAEAADMDELAAVIAGRLAVKRFDLAQSTYALYYAKEPVAVLEAMLAALKPGGRLAVCVPNDPHTLSRFMAQFVMLPEAVVSCTKFGKDVLEPFFRAQFEEVTIHLLRNRSYISSAADVMTFLRNASYYDPAVEDRVLAAVEAEIAAKGSFLSEKNSLLIIGRTSGAA